MGAGTVCGMTRIDDIARAGAASAAAQAERTAARDASVRACRAMETALHHALAGARLHGLPNVGTGTRPYRAVRLRAAHIDVRLSVPEGVADRGPEALCLDDCGRLVVARMVRRAGLHVEARLVEDAEILAEDAESMGELIATVLEEHSHGIQAAEVKFAAFRVIAERIAGALDDEPPPIHLLDGPGAGTATVV